MSFKLSNFNAPNTPAVAQVIGNICLIFAMIGAAIMIVNTALTPPATMPQTLITISIWCTAIGGLGKGLSKFFGTT